MEEFLDQEFINTLAIVNDQSVTYSIDLENMKGVESIALLLSLFLAEIQVKDYQCNAYYLTVPTIQELQS